MRLGRILSVQNIVDVPAVETSDETTEENSLVTSSSKGR